VPDPIAPVTLVGCAPVAELRIDAGTPDPLGAVARFVETSPLLDPALPFPLGTGVVGCLAYELGAWTVPGLARPPATDRSPCCAGTIRCSRSITGARRGRSSDRPIARRLARAVRGAGADRASGAARGARARARVRPRDRTARRSLASTRTCTRATSTR
jgi:hypothetical protein